MKDWDFIERLNHYIDGELPAHLVPQLESELQADPAKMRLYRQYLRLERGSQVLLKAIEGEADRPRVDLGRNVIWVPRTVRPRERQNAGPNWWVAAGGAFAAACVAVVFVQSGGSPGSARSQEGLANGIPVEPLATLAAAAAPRSESTHRRIRREVPRLESWGRLVAIEVPSEIPEVPVNLPVPPSAPPSVRVQESVLPIAGMPAFHGGRGTFSPAAVTANFAAYEFQR